MRTSKLNRAQELDIEQVWEKEKRKTDTVQTLDIRDVAFEKKS